MLYKFLLMILLLSGCSSAQYVGQIHGGWTLEDFNRTVTHDNLLHGITAETITPEYYFGMDDRKNPQMGGSLILIKGVESEAQMQYFVNTYTVLVVAGKLK